jgi:hypothetical protein
LNPFGGGAGGRRGGKIGGGGGCIGRGGKIGGGGGRIGRGGPFDTVSTIRAPGVTGTCGKGCCPTTQLAGASDAVGGTCDAARPCRARIAMASANGLPVTFGIGLGFGLGGGGGAGLNGRGLALLCATRRGGAPDCAKAWLVGLSMKAAQAGDEAIRTARPSPAPIAVRRRRFGNVAARPGAVMAFPRPTALSRLARTPPRLGGAPVRNKHAASAEAVRSRATALTSTSRVVMAAVKGSRCKI